MCRDIRCWKLKASDETKLTAILSLWTTRVSYVDSSVPGISPGCFNNLIKLLNQVTYIEGVRT